MALPCNKCSHRQSVPGSAHIQCTSENVETSFIQTYALMKHRIPAQKWFSFPFNYDPVWGPDECKAFETKIP